MAGFAALLACDRLMLYVVCVYIRERVVVLHPTATDPPQQTPTAMIEPSTPPRSRAAADGGAREEALLLARKPAACPLPPNTPQKSSQDAGLRAPVTPSTARQTGKTLLRTPQVKRQGLGALGQGALLPPPSSSSSSLQFNGLNSPEFSPMRRLSIPNSTLGPASSGLGQSPHGLGHGPHDSVSRMLFPIDVTAEQQQQEEADHTRKPLLLPPARSPKAQKTTPGTPSHKIISLQQAKQWNNISDGEPSDDDDDDDEQGLVTRAPQQPNPFLSSTPPLTSQQRRLRHDQLLRENPELETTVTYLDKRGQVAKQRTLTPKERDRYKPRALFHDK